MALDSTLLDSEAGLFRGADEVDGCPPDLARRKVRVMIADDDSKHTQGLLHMVMRLRPAWRVVATAATAAEVLHVQDRHEPDLCLLNARLSGTASGLSVAREVSAACPVICLTDDPSHALAAFDEGVADLVLKPVRLARLELALERAERLMGDAQAARSSELPEGGDGRPPRYVQVMDGSRAIWTRVEEIRCLQAEHKHTRVVLQASSGFIRQGLQFVTKWLDPKDFWQIHRSTVVHTRFIDQVFRDELGRMVVKLQGSPQLHMVSKSKERLFRQDFIH